MFNKMPQMMIIDHNEILTIIHHLFKIQHNAKIHQLVINKKNMIQRFKKTLKNKV